jgi:cytochrome c peroxidase
MKTTLFAVIAICALFLASCSKDNEIPIFSGYESVEIESRAVTLNSMEQLGKKIFFDNISFPNKQSCATCHSPNFGFTGNHPGANLKEGIYRGANSARWGFRKPPTSAYATFSPVLHYDYNRGTFIGGNNWDGSATGAHLGTPAEDQALLPFLNPLEQNNMSKEFVLLDIANSNYASLWEDAWGEPIHYSTPEQADLEYHKVARAIAAYEASQEVNAFSSRFDAYLQGVGLLTAEELWGMELFNNKGKCSNCHSTSDSPPLFTDFSYQNIGVPRNPNNPYYEMDGEYFDNGEPINPSGANWIDYGLGAFLETHSNPAWQALASASMGKFKVPTVRNVARKNGGGNTKAYMHNGIFKTLEEVVHFHNTRDVGAWPDPEVTQNLNTTDVGNLGLTIQEEKAIVAFLKTLSDGSF